MSLLQEWFDDLCKLWRDIIVEPSTRSREENAALMAEWYREHGVLPESQKADIWNAQAGLPTTSEIEERNKTWIAQTRKVLTDTKAPKSMLDAFDLIIEAKWPVNIIGAFGVWLTWEGFRVGTVAKVIGSEAAFSTAREMRPTRPDPATLWRMAFTDKGDRSKVLGALADLGYDDDFIKGMERANRMYTGAAEAMALWRRGEIDEMGFFNRLAQLGFDPDAMIDLAKLKEVIPGIGDLISMGVREAWRDDVAQRYGYDEDYPAELTTWAEKQGLSRDWCKRFWRAHWILPGPAMGREMLWRTSMDEAAYKDLLRIADYPRAFRDWMTEISYAPWTRVDIRRMHKLGVIPDRAGLERAYGDIGYHGRQLDGIIDFTIAYNAEEERDYTRTDILAAYELGRFNRTEALGALVSIGYSQMIADVWLAKADLSRANAYARERITQVKTLYRGKRITRTEAHNQLTGIPIPSQEADTYLELWDVGRAAEVGRPSKTELRRFFIQNILDESAFRTELAGHHLSATYIDWYVEDAKLDLADAMMKEQERTQKEEERVRKSIITSDRDKELARIDVLIAESNVSIADIKLSMIPEMPDEDVDKSKKLILAFKVLIAELRERKALVRVAYYAEVRP